jgi:putative two-component system response regulator
MVTLADELSNPLILIVDDEFLQRLPMRSALEQAGYRVAEAENGLQAWQFIRESRPDMVISDVVMPDMDGFALCQKIRHKKDFEHLPVVMATSLDDITSVEQAYRVGATDFISKPINWSMIGYRVRHILRAARTAQKLSDRELELLHTRMEIIRRLGQAAEYRDNETGGHIQRMSRYAHCLGQAVGLSRQELELLLTASPMHDVGKIGIPDSILLKPGKLTESEFAVMKTHTLLGGELLDREPSLLLQTAHTIALTHHERWDGMGYPHGLSGEQIPLVGRICSLADVFDALTSKRPYKNPWSVEESLAEIKRCSGTAFDPRLVDVFTEILDDILEIMRQHADDLYGTPAAAPVVAALAK